MQQRLDRIAKASKIRRSTELESEELLGATANAIHGVKRERTPAADLPYRLRQRPRRRDTRRTH